ncbi:Chromosome III, complete sequence, related [Eimeria maxima]|uniref:Chromosome III, complete sequence, related n=1 Tax=Eimeria maxima TaxID=5804 RepID=U6M8L0_EIMMA|nr:Chromosome III, complete sequence, related [Eimeria maxima]CDJ60366.1 Chromosome III, complete sequence, related [Eimeria maxima]
MLKLGGNSETPDTQAFADDLASADASPEQEARPKPTRTGRGLPLRERKVYRNLARYTPRVQGLTFDHNQIRWISYWKNEQNKQVQKHFPVSRFGFFGARLMALEERNRIQGWPLFADEAFHLIEGLKIFVKSNPEYAAALLQGGELDPVTGEIHLNVYAEQVLESCSATLEERIAASLATGLRALPPQVDAGGRNQRSKPTTATAVSTRQPPPPPLSQDDDDCSVQRRASVGVATRRQRAARLRTASRRNGVTSNPAERRAAAPTQLGGSGGQEEVTLPLPAFEEKKGEVQQSTDSGMATYADVLAQAYALSMGGVKVDATTTHQLSLPRSSQEEHLPPPNLDCRKPKVLPALLPATSGTVYLEGGGDSSVSSRLVSMASSSYEESEPLVDSCALVEQEPDALRDLLNCDVSEPMDTGVDWEVEGSNTATIVDVSRPTRNPLTRQSRQF